MRAREVAELDDLVPAEAGEAVGDDEVPLARHDRQLRSQAPGFGARGVDDDSGPKRLAVRGDGAGRKGIDAAAFAKFRAVFPGPLEQRDGRGGRIDDRVSRNAKRAGEPRAKIRLERGEAGRVHDFRGDPGARVCEALLLDGVELFFVLGDPERAARVVFARRRKLFASERQSRFE